MRAAATLTLLCAVACDDGKSSGDGSAAGDGKQPHDIRLTEAGKPMPDGTTPGAAKVGDPCTSDQDCVEPPQAQCFRTVGGGMVPSITFPGGYCSRGCGDEDAGSPDCGEGGGCAQLGLSGGRGSVTMSLCAKGCKKNEDCRAAEGYTCRIIFPGFPGFCAPP